MTNRNSHVFRNTLLRNTTHTSQAPFDADDGQQTSPSCSRLRLMLTGDVKTGPKLITGRGADCYVRVPATEQTVSVVMLNSFLLPPSRHTVAYHFLLYSMYY